MKIRDTAIISLLSEMHRGAPSAKIAAGFRYVAYNLFGKVPPVTALASPLDVGILVTLRCTRRCPGCVNMELLENPDLKKEMSVEDVGKLAKSPLLRSAMWVSLKGGEPLMNKNLPSMVAILRAEGKFVSITSNADLLDRSRLEELRRAGLSWINISYYGDNEDSIRRAMDAARDGAFNPEHFSIFAHADDTALLKKAYDFSKDAGLGHFFYSCDFDLQEDVPEDKLQRLDETFPAFREHVDADGGIAEIGLLPPRLYAWHKNGGRPYCRHAATHFKIAPDFTVAPCCALHPDEKWGNVDDPSGAVEFKKTLLDGHVPAVCRRCPELGGRGY